MPVERLVSEVSGESRGVLVQLSGVENEKVVRDHPPKHNLFQLQLVACVSSCRSPVFSGKTSTRALLAVKESGVLLD